MDIGRALRARAVLVQDLESPVALEELVVKLLALQVCRVTFCSIPCPLLPHCLCSRKNVSGVVTSLTLVHGCVQVGAFDDVDPTRVKLAASMCVHDCWLTYPEVSPTSKSKPQ